MTYDAVSTQPALGTGSVRHKRLRPARNAFACPACFATLARCLKPGARACVQTIAIDEALFARYRRSTDFIQRYVFPGGMLPAPGVFEAQARAAGLHVVGRLAFGRHYAKTLATWRARFEARLAAVRALGFDDRFIAIWRFYLA